MQKTKKVTRVITILVIVYIFFNIVWNSVKIGNEWMQETQNEFSIESLRMSYEREYNSLTPEERSQKQMKPIAQMSDKELQEGYQKSLKFIMLFIIVISVFTTLVQNSYLIILMIVIKVVDNKVWKEKLNHDDFKKRKEYYRDILTGYGICELSWIDDFKLDVPSDIIAELLQLENKKIVRKENDRLIVNKEYEKGKLTIVQQYLIEHIKDGKITGINQFQLEEKIKVDALEHGFVEERNNLQKRQIKKIFGSIAIWIVLFLLTNYFLNGLETLYLEDVGSILIVFVISLLVIVVTGFYPIIAIISFIVYTIKAKTNPYFRTKKGNEINIKIEGLKKFLQDYTLLDEKQSQEIILWEEYLTYSILFKQNKKIVQEYTKYIQE